MFLQTITPEGLGKMTLRPRRSNVKTLSYLTLHPDFNLAETYIL
jgi:hypothetical protein